MFFLEKNVRRSHQWSTFRGICGSEINGKWSENRLITKRQSFGTKIKLLECLTDRLQLHGSPALNQNPKRPFDYFDSKLKHFSPNQQFFFVSFLGIFKVLRAKIHLTTTKTKIRIVIKSQLRIRQQTDEKINDICNLFKSD